MLYVLASLLLFPFVTVADVFTRDDCWCRNATHLGWKRHLQLDSINIEGGAQIMDQWCFQATSDGRGECLDWHTRHYRVCASHESAHNSTRRNDFCYWNHGNARGFVPHWSKGKDAIKWNKEKREIPFKNQPMPVTMEETIAYCEPVCRDFLGWDLPVMDPWSPSKHGVVECRHQVFSDITDFSFQDGVGDDWPYKQTYHDKPGEFSTTPEGMIDYWEISKSSELGEPG
ncbi:MAG: hypothetical protein LQ344_003938 [Seirophora lacunosa]|nr:MAG: hypothetical protein LQ344_003938 [Seirophora lacunosa]